MDSTLRASSTAHTSPLKIGPDGLQHGRPTRSQPALRLLGDVAVTGPSIQTLWNHTSGLDLVDDLVQWPPDVFAVTEIALERSEAFRFAISPPAGRSWPPVPIPEWNGVVSSAAEQWCAWAEERSEALPDVVALAWLTLLEEMARPLEHLTSGQAWALCEALLTLHAIADQACAGMGVSVYVAAPGGRTTRARARELLARTGSLARVPRDRLRVLPKVRTAEGGSSHRALSRYVCVLGPAVDAVWHKAPARRRGSAQPHANILLLPWPLQVQDGDFRPVPGSVQHFETDPFGYFDFAPPDRLDFDLLDRVLTAAHEQADGIDAVVLPESAVPPEDLEELERLLTRHRVSILVAGVREPPPGAGERFPPNWVHLGVNVGGRWWHYHQHKHHRWSLDHHQIEQYHLGGTLDPTVRWWEAIEVPRRAVQFIELGQGITFVAVVCEDLGRLDEVADLLRAVGPTLVVTVLLDGPQLTNRWTARYASVLADDPGSAVLTLTAYGFVQRSQPAGHPPSSQVALWKDPARGFRELALDRGSHGILLTAQVDTTWRRTADGRLPEVDAPELVVTAVRQVRAADHTVADYRPSAAVNADLQPVELTILTSWAEAVAEALAGSDGPAATVLTDARPGAPWRQLFGLEEPSAQLAAAVDALAKLVQEPDQGNGDPLTRLAGSVLTAAIESRAARSPQALAAAP